MKLDGFYFSLFLERISVNNVVDKVENADKIFNFFSICRV